jgi:hypothetical protein
MITTDRFVFLHLHKSGGTFVNECLLRCIPGALQIGYHLPRMFVPPSHAHLPAIGLVRSPWSYYVSWYAFQKQRPRPNVLFSVLSENDTLDFSGTIRNMLMLADDEGRIRRIAAGLPTAYVNRGLNLPGFALLPVRGTGLGFYSFLERHVHGNGARLHIGRMERLREELPRMLEEVGQPVTDTIARFIGQEPKRNTSMHDAYVDYYDSALRALVAERDGALIERMGYRFGD